MRFSVSLPPSLVEEFDDMWRGMRYGSRSKALHDAVRGFITEAQRLRQGAGVVVGAVIVLRYLDVPGVQADVAGVERAFRGVIASIQQLYVEENKMLEVIAVRGGAAEIGRLAEELAALRGVKQVKASVVAP